MQAAKACLQLQWAMAAIGTADALLDGKFCARKRFMAAARAPAYKCVRLAICYLTRQAAASCVAPCGALASCGRRWMDLLSFGLQAA